MSGIGPTPALRALLIRAATDLAFCERFRDDPEAVMAAHALAGDEADAIREGGAALLALMGRVMAAEAGIGAPASPDTAAEAGTPDDPFAAPEPLAHPPQGPEIRLLLRLMTSATEAGGGAAALGYAAALHMLAPGARAEDEPAPDLDPDALPGERLPDTLLEVRLRPQLLREGAGYALDCPAAMLPVGRSPPPGTSGPAPVAEEVAEEVADHAAALAAALRDAPEAERHARALALVAALDTEGDAS